MGLFKDLKNMKDTVHAAPDMIRQAQDLGAQAQALGAAQAQNGGLGNPMTNVGLGGPPGIVTAAELEPIAGISLEKYAQFAKTVGEKRLDGDATESLVVAQGFAPGAWQQAYDGWNARMKVNMALSTQFGQIYQTTAAL
jgi:hypothetical protein